LTFCCCDYSSEVLNSQCNYLGDLGGFWGNRVINGENFDNAKFIKTVWSVK